MPKTWLDKINIIIDKIKETVQMKHHDYGDNNLKRRGELGIIFRIEDKLARIENLLTTQPMAKESRTKEWLGICECAIQAVVLFAGEFDPPTHEHGDTDTGSYRDGALVTGTKEISWDDIILYS